MMEQNTSDRKMKNLTGTFKGLFRLIIVSYFMKGGVGTIALAMVLIFWVTAFTVTPDTITQIEPIDTSTQHTSDSLENLIPPIEKLPEFTEYKKAQYPARELREGVEGTVELELVISD